jgi:two-component system cell cycle sensor histidine kinase/response regulator CckA
MAGGERSERQGRAAYDKTLSVPRSGSILLVLLVAVVLIGAAAGAVYIPAAYSGVYILALLAILSTVGVIGLFATAAGILRSGGRKATHPLLKSVADNDSDGVLVTDHSGRVFYANAAYLDLIGAPDESDVRPIERVFIGDPDVSESIYRLLKAAREGRRLQEEVRISTAPGRNCSTRSIISTTRRPASSPSMPRATSSI